jgi:hypothetical protein
MMHEGWNQPFGVGRKSNGTVAGRWGLKLWLNPGMDSSLASVLALDDRGSSAAMVRVPAATTRRVAKPTLPMKRDLIQRLADIVNLLHRTGCEANGGYMRQRKPV